MNDISNLADTVTINSAQLNADDLLSGPITIRIASVTRNNAEQPIAIGFDGDNGKPWRPGKSMRKVLLFAWGENGNDWIGRSLTLYNEPTVKYGGVEVGGIRISHLSHIKSDITLSLNATRGKKSSFTVRRLAVQAPAALTPEIIATMKDAASKGTEFLKQAFAALTPAEQAALKANQPMMDALRSTAAAFVAASPTATAPADATDSKETK